MKLIILDRDGVINQDSDQFIKSPEEWKPIPGSLEAIARLNQWGWRVVVASNQSGVGRGLFGMDTLNAINDRMVKALAQVGGRLDAIFFCPHAADSTCDCRKPKPGLLLQIAERFNVDLDGVPVVGDSLRDLQAAVAAGARPYLVLTGKGEQTRENPELPPATLVYPDLDAIAAELTA
ncbi:D-glycero-beta-D-manno-heptose 1,7-bisphosphate 7-phosphatase [Thauera sp. GDN1]|uniref:D-glycero-beta-D-manno-heptose 1,7-bisphosphate 7-phosphatase n=1 Tax=Thauera sp. GDN1 TaxID=2944810 RepID=UPI002478EF17|nr:D-glycero-beta-D-manno-heptose 1,7-bisphosphate 7-phosphatase [Thauera sp. GDN1]